MPGSSTTPGRQVLAYRHLDVLPSALETASAPRNNRISRLNGWPMPSPTDASPAFFASAAARLGANVDRYSFIVVDLHHLLLAGLPAHFESDVVSLGVGSSRSVETLVKSAAIASFKISNVAAAALFDVANLAIVPCDHGVEYEANVPPQPRLTKPRRGQTQAKTARRKVEGDRHNALGT